MSVRLVERYWDTVEIFADAIWSICFYSIWTPSILLRAWLICYIFNCQKGFVVTVKSDKIISSYGCAAFHWTVQFDVTNSPLDKLLIDHYLVTKSAVAFLSINTSLSNMIPYHSTTTALVICYPKCTIPTYRGKYIYIELISDISLLFSLSLKASLSDHNNYPLAESFNGLRPNVVNFNLVSSMSYLCLNAVSIPYLCRIYVVSMSLISMSS